MKRSKNILSISFVLYLIISLSCLSLYFVPVINKVYVFQVWMICTQVFRLSLAMSMCVLLVKIIRLQKIKRKLKKWRS